MAAQFPPSGIREDSKLLQLTFEDNAIVSETDGGYNYSRPRHSRPPRRHITTGITCINQAQVEQLQAFIMRVNKHTMFSYILPTTQELLDVRFEEIPTIKYTGVGGHHCYDVPDIKLVEV